MRITSAVSRPPVPHALDSLESLLASPSLRLLTPGDHSFRLLRALTEESATRGNHIFDAQIATVCLEHGASTLLTEDRDFARFRKLKPVSLEEFGAPVKGWLAQRMDALPKETASAFSGP